MTLDKNNYYDNIHSYFLLMQQYFLEILKYQNPLRKSGRNGP